MLFIFLHWTDAKITTSSLSRIIVIISYIHQAIIITVDNTSTNSSSVRWYGYESVTTNPYTTPTYSHSHSPSWTQGWWVKNVCPLKTAQLGPIFLHAKIWQRGGRTGKEIFRWKLSNVVHEVVEMRWAVFFGIKSSFYWISIYYPIPFGLTRKTVVQNIENGGDTSHNWKNSLNSRTANHVLVSQTSDELTTFIDWLDVSTHRK